MSMERRADWAKGRGPRGPIFPKSIPMFKVEKKKMPPFKNQQQRRRKWRRLFFAFFMQTKYSIRKVWINISAPVNFDNGGSNFPRPEELGTWFNGEMAVQKPAIFVCACAIMLKKRVSDLLACYHRFIAAFKMAAFPTGSEMAEILYTEEKLGQPVSRYWVK